MKDITTKISESVTHIESESSGKAFKEQVKYSKSDWEKWKKEAKDKAKRWNKMLTPGEKKYYRIKYSAVKANKLIELK